LTVVCADHGDADPDAVEYAGVAPRIASRARADARETLALCREWRIEVLPRTVLEPVRSDIPTLLLSGAYDPITPPSFALQVASTLTTSTHVVFPGGTHGQAFGEACATGIMRAFLDQPTAAPDAACARQSVSPYLVPTDLFVLPALRNFMSDIDAGVVARRFHVLLGALLVLATALVVYPVGRTRNWLRGETQPAVGGRGMLSRWAPWLAVATLVVFVLFLWALRGAVARAAEVSPALVYLGAILRRDWWVFVLASFGAALTAVVVVAAVALWAGRQRSVEGRVYYSVLALAAVVASFSLWRLGLLGSGLYF
jgi:hypothetical protein